MIAYNQSMWSFKYDGSCHTWTTGQEYNVSIDTDAGTLTFDSDSGNGYVIPLEVAKAHHKMFEEVFGLTFEDTSEDTEETETIELSIGGSEEQESEEQESEEQESEEKESEESEASE